MSRRRALVLGTAALLLVPWPDATAESPRFWPRQDERPLEPARTGSTAGPAPGQATAPGRPGPATGLQVHDRGSHYEVIAGNPLPGPVQVRLSRRGGAQLHAVPALPLEAVLAAGSVRSVARLYRTGTATMGALDLGLAQVPGDPRARPQDFPYRLPFRGVPVRVDQGANGRYSHHDDANRHALDFALAEGTAVLAARAGVVMEIIDDDPRGGHSLRILHDDGGMAVYAHLQHGSIPLRVGEPVEQGQRIAHSGNTGTSTAPHLHFAVQVNVGMHLRSIPFRMFADAGELKLPRDAARTSN